MKTDPTCRLYTGFKPCRYKRSTCEGCTTREAFSKFTAIINLDALGDVLRGSSILHHLRAQDPGRKIWWFTSPRAADLLKNHPSIDRVIAIDSTTPLLLQTVEFDEMICLDKSLTGGALASQAKAKIKHGFGVGSDGSIIPFNSHANELFEMGLDDEIKFLKNQKTMDQLLVELVGLKYEEPRRYELHLSDEEWVQVGIRRAGFSKQGPILGINVGCSPTYPYKKLSVPHLERLLERLFQVLPSDVAVVLLGGIEDTDRVRMLKAKFPWAIETATTLGLRDGAQSVAACDVVFTGDSLGLHLSVALGKRVVVWFGPSCAQEIELFGLGEKVVSTLSCSPCWKRECHKVNRCNDLISLTEITDRLLEQIEIARPRIYAENTLG